MRLMFTSYTYKRNAKKFDLFVLVRWFLTKFNLGTVIINNADSCYFKLYFLHQREVAVFDRALTEESGNLIVMPVMSLTAWVFLYKSLSLSGTFFIFEIKGLS